MKKKVSYVSNDNSEHPTELACREQDANLNGFTFLCPACNGIGIRDGEPITDSVYDAEATGWGGAFATPVYKTVITGYEKVSCDVCGSHGWTEKEKLAIIQESVIGWQDKST